MRQLTFELNVKVADGIEFALIPQRRLIEEHTLNAKIFDAIVLHVRNLGCSYRVDQIEEPTFLHGSGVLPKTAPSLGLIK